MDTGHPIVLEGQHEPRFYAYYPYDAAATDPTNIVFNVQADQSDITAGKSNYILSDLLTAKSTGPSASPASGWAKDSTVSLQFAHALAMVQVSVPSPGKGFGPSENLTVTLRNVKPGAAVAGAAAPRAAARRAGATPTPTTLTTLSGSAWCSFLSSLALSKTGWCWRREQVA